VQHYNNRTETSQKFLQAAFWELHLLAIEPGVSGLHQYSSISREHLLDTTNSLFSSTFSRKGKQEILEKKSLCLSASI